MIYLLTSKFHPTVLIVAIEEVAALRALLSRQGFARKPAGNPSLFTGLVAWMMTEGTKAEAEALRARFPAAFRIELAGGPLFWNQDSPELREWAERHALPWDGSESRRLGVAPLGKRLTEARESSLGERVCSRNPTA